MVELLLDNSFQNDLKKWAKPSLIAAQIIGRIDYLHLITKQTIRNILTNPLLITIEEYAGLDQIVKQLPRIAFTLAQAAFNYHSKVMRIVSN